MPYFRVERKAGDEWVLVHGRVETRDKVAAVAYNRTVLPHTTKGQLLRASEVVDRRPGQPERRPAA